MSPSSFRLALSLLLVAGLAACDKPGSAESAGKRLDQAAESAGRQIEQTAEAAGRKLNETTDRVGGTAGEQGQKAAAAIEDAEITARVKAAIFAEPGLKSLQIGVDTVNGVVTLTGSVDSQPGSERVKLLAAATAGVKDVDNKLVTKSIRTD